jgi:heterodisulfide reductase subunit B
MKYIFYPGCSMERNARAYLDSLMAIREPLGIELEEIDDWNCCGATEFMSVSPLAGHALIGRNLALAEQQTNGTHTVMAGCSACYLNLSKTDHYMLESPQLSETINTALAAGGLHYTPGALKVRHLLDVLMHDVGLEAIQRNVVRPLQGLRVAPYYGCMILRPDFDHRFNYPEYPAQLDQILGVLGAEVIDFPMKLDCCGGHMTQISKPVALELIRRLIHAAAEYKADMLVTLCPMCQLNLDAYQAEMNHYFHTDYHIAITYFTQLIGLAFGKEAKELGFGKEFVDARPALSRIGVQVPVTEPVATPKPKRSKQALPMPSLTRDKGETRR